MLKRKKLLDHFAVVVSDGSGAEPRVTDRWPRTDHESAYELPPALPYFVTETSSVQTIKKAAVRKRWFGRNSSSTSHGGGASHVAAAANTAASSSSHVADKSTPVKFYPIVLTGASGERIYGGTLLRTVAGVGSQPQSSTQALCFLSRFPFFSLFHDLLRHIHALSWPVSPPSPGAVVVAAPTKRQGASAIAAAKAAAEAATQAVVDAASAASRAESPGDVFLQLVLGGHGPLGLHFANFMDWDGKSRVCVVEARGQAAAAGVCVGDEILELNGEPVSAGTYHGELPLRIANARGASGQGQVLLLVRPEASSAARLSALASSSNSTSALGGAASRGGGGGGGPGRAAAQRFGDVPRDEAGLPRVGLHSLERLVPHLMAELRLPPAVGCLDATLGPGPRGVRYSRSASGALPRVEDASFAVLWRLLSVPSVVRIVEALAMEQRVVLIAEDVAALAPVAEALLSFLFPLSWTHVYIPLLPAELLLYLEAPVPFFVGICSSYLSLDVVAATVYAAPDDDNGCCCVFLDSDTVCLPGEAYAHREAGGGDRPCNRPEAADGGAAGARIPDILRASLLASLAASTAPLRAATDGLPLFSPRRSVAAVASAAGARMRRVRFRKARRERLVRPSGDPSLVVLEEDWFAVSGGKRKPGAGTAGVGLPASAATAGDAVAAGDYGDSALLLDYDGPRFFFLHLWAELLLPYTGKPLAIAERTRAHEECTPACSSTPAQWPCYSTRRAELT